MRCVIVPLKQYAADDDEVDNGIYHIRLISLHAVVFFLERVRDLW